MRIQEHILEKLQARKRNSEEIAMSLIMYPQCMDGHSKRQIAYQVATEYFIEKEKCCKTVRDVYSHNGRTVIELAVLLDCYEAAKGEEKENYAKQIARTLIDTQEYFLMRVYDEIKEPAFRIAIQYLEKNRDA